MTHFGFPLETILIFLGVVVFSIYLDLFAHKKSKEITVGDAARWSVFWVGMALVFYAYLWLRFDKSWADLYLAGYALEKSLSIDNLMVFMAIFASFGIRGILQHRILYYGIVGALVFRAIFVVIGAGLFQASPWVGFLFAAFVLWSAVQMLRQSGKENKEIEDYSDHWSVRMTGRLMPVYTRLHLDRFFIRQHEMLEKDGEAEGAATNTPNVPDTTNAPDTAARAGRMGRLYATPAFLCLVAIETSDIAFAFDSVPAVIAVTQEPLLVYAAMIFAILGLRSLYFVLAALTRYLVHLEKAVIGLLFFIGAKMALQSYEHVCASSSFFGLDLSSYLASACFDIGIHISPGWSLAIVLGMLALGVVASLLFPAKNDAA
ncbi:MAG: TerC/Alx family metal homeostasis membrane protein [Zoogloeaceae bacterium]|jgi:tellurite resistance protein TerC|nr:TerC/Alx family metal homeostasis membrane protein [Zoogloeaceae bacterium]